MAGAGSFSELPGPAVFSRLARVFSPLALSENLSAEYHRTQIKSCQARSDLSDGSRLIFSADSPADCRLPHGAGQFRIFVAYVASLGYAGRAASTTQKHICRINPRAAAGKRDRRSLNLPILRATNRCLARRRLPDSRRMRTQTRRARGSEACPQLLTLTSGPRQPLSQSSESAHRREAWRRLLLF